MKRIGKILTCLTGGWLLVATARADNAALPDNPYATIITRNIFGLLPPPTSPPEQKPPDPPVKITANGLMNIFGQWQVLFKAQMNRPGSKEQSYMLSEGQQQDDIEVVKIDQKASIVTFNNHGVEQKLPLANTPASDGSSSPASNFPSPARNFPGAGPGAGGNSGNPFGGRGNPFGGRNFNANPANNFNNGANSGANPGMNFGNNVNANRTYQPEAGTMTPEETQINVVANKLKLMQEGNPIYRAYPPTALDAQAGVSGDGNGSGDGSGDTPAP